MNQDRLQSGEFQLNSRDVTGAIRPLFDIAGSKVSTSILNTASPLNCLQNNYILVESEIPDTDVGACTATYRVPYDDGSAQGWTCESINQKLVFTKTFEENFLAPETGGGICYEVHITLDGELVKSVSNTDESCNPTIQNYSYKSIASEIKHVSPTSSELGAQVMSMVTPSLPIDRDRYVDFVGARGNYARIDYPQLFRVGVEA
ncbi:MAG: hypothetical protein H6767_06820 [Candidatus Peribacteria bacterium]|nr:MAG: hypothetical protein H6767_06820 [Candidatus Peribacteria bacterium]